MNDSFGGDFNSTTSAGAKEEKKSEGVLPCLVKQIHDSPEGNLQMWGMSFGMVTCVCIVRNIESSSTKITYTLEDHTGIIDAHYWLEEGDALKSPDVMLNNYAKIFGTTRQHGGKKTLMLFKMFPVTDMNEITTHLLEVLMARYKSEEFSKAIGNDNSDFTMGGGGGVSSGFREQHGNNLGLDGKHLAIFQCIKNCTTDEGVSRRELKAKFNHISSNELEGIIDFMTQEGHIYTSIDCDHFLATDM